MRALLHLLAGSLVAAASCDRVPPEPPRAAPAPEVAIDAAAASVPTVRAPTRCVRPLPPTPPPTVAPAAAARCPRDPDRAPPKVPLARVTFPGTPAPALTVEQMLSEAHQARGLMYRTRLDDDRGMLFAWDDTRVRTFWMHDTCLPLDMLFLDRDGFVVGIVESAAPLTDDARSVPCPAAYVLEVPAGWSRRHGVAPGSTAHIER